MATSTIPACTDGSTYAPSVYQHAAWAVTIQAASGEPEIVIPAAVQREGIGPLVIGAYGHSPIRHLILGSATTTMVRTCLVPVLTFR